MAIVRSLEAGASNVRENRTEVDATYQIVDTATRGKLLHISTFGSDSRKSEPKVSQVLQFDETTARELASIISRAFPLHKPSDTLAE